ncbi:uncharacterized protein [Antedon mediterranea]|uniref:uncharacterized protein n=1 Tax=Antedon mediterranea TaxID=105859 RepID=UPI003AF87B3F
MAQASDNSEEKFHTLTSCLDEILWSEKTCTVKEIFSSCSFPIIVKVVDSYLTNSDTDSYPTDEILWINGASEQRYLIMDSSSNESWSVPMSNNYKIRSVMGGGYKLLSEVKVEKEEGEWSTIHPEFCDAENFDINQMRHQIFGCDLRVRSEHSMVFLTGYSLSSDMMLGNCPISVIKHHPEQTFSLGTGLRGQTSTNWSKFCLEFSSLLGESLEKPKFPGITLYSLRQTMNTITEAITEVDMMPAKKEIRLRTTENKIKEKPDEEKTQKRGKTKLKTRSMTRISSVDETNEKISKKKRKSFLTMRRSKSVQHSLLEQEQYSRSKYDYSDADDDDAEYMLPTEFVENVYDDLQSDSESLVESVVNLSVTSPEQSQRQLPPVPTADGDLQPSISYKKVLEPPTVGVIPEGFYEEIVDMPQEVEQLQISNEPILSRDDLPDDLNNLSMSQVSDCLHLLHLDKHIESFKESDIDGIILNDLTKDILINDLGLTSIEALKLRKFVDQKWLPESS